MSIHKSQRILGSDALKQHFQKQSPVCETFSRLTSEAFRVSKF